MRENQLACGDKRQIADALYKQEGARKEALEANQPLCLLDYTR